MVDTLTGRQSQVLDFIRACTEGRGYPPSLREIATAVGLQSVSSVSYVLGALARAGYIERVPGNPRAIVLVDQPTVPVRREDLRHLVMLALPVTRDDDEFLGRMVGLTRPATAGDQLATVTVLPGGEQ